MVEKIGKGGGCDIGPGSAIKIMSLNMLTTFLCLNSSCPSQRSRFPDGSGSSTV